jgi:hypothetical protein
MRIKAQNTSGQLQGNHETVTGGKINDRLQGKRTCLSRQKKGGTTKKGES